MSQPARVVMSAPEFREALRLSMLSQREAAWMLGVGLRHVRAWCLGEYAVPHYARLIITAYREGRISAAWLQEMCGDISSAPRA